MSTTEPTTLPEYRVRACNTASESENKIHDDTVAAEYGFRGGLVPGVIVYGYMTAPLVIQYSLDFLERGSMQVKFHQPFYEGDEVVIRCDVDAESSPIKIAVTASNSLKNVCATALATIDDPSSWLGEPDASRNPEDPDPPSSDGRPIPSLELFKAGTPVPSIKEVFDAGLRESELLDRIDDPLEIYRGGNGIAHPAYLLGLCNQMLVRNYMLGPWIHTSSEIKNWGTARNGDDVVVSGSIRESFERGGHEFVVLDLRIDANAKLIQQVRHTAIFRPRRG